MTGVVRTMTAAAVVAAAMVASGLLMVPGASADAPDATGWWAAHRTTPPNLGLPTNPPLDQPDRTVPDGGLYVAGEHATVPDGPQNPAPQRTGVSAVRLFVGPDAAVGDLVLTFHKENGVDRAEGVVAIQACPSTIVWTPDEGGPITSAPPHDCSTGLAFGSVVESTVRIPVGGLVRNGELNVVLMPQPGSAFQAVFANPGPNAVAVTRYERPTGGGGGGGGGGTGTTCTTCLPPTVPTVPYTPVVDPVGEILVLPPPPADDTETAAPPADDEPEDIFPAVGDRPADRFRLEGWKQAVAGAVLGALAVLYVLLLRLPQRAPRLLAVPAMGGASAEVPRGIGRFARPRTGPPPQL